MATKSMLIVDEVSMISLSTLQEIEQQCRSIRDTNSSWGGLKVILLCGDFYQFPPVRGRALWQGLSEIDIKELTSSYEGQLIWHSFSKVILLNEQMRQSEDIPYAHLLKRIRSATSTTEDYLFLIERVGQLQANEGTKIIVRSNQLRQHLNIKSIVEFAESHNQPLYIFMAEHYSKDESVAVDKWRSLAVVDKGSTSPGPGLFCFTKNMPIVVNQNLYTSLGIVNGKEGTAIDAVIDPLSQVYRLDCHNQHSEWNQIWIIDRPPKCLFIKVNNPKFSILNGLSNGVLPLFPTTFSIDVPLNILPNQKSNTKTTSIRRRQIPCSPAFAITDYRSQGRTFNEVILDFESAKKGGNNQHSTFTATYVALSRCRSIAGLSFLRAFPASSFFVKPDIRLEQEMGRLILLEEATLSIDYIKLLSLY